MTHDAIGTYGGFICIRSRSLGCLPHKEGTPRPNGLLPHLQILLQPRHLQRGGKSCCSIASIRTGARRNPDACGTNQCSWKRRFAPPWGLESTLLPGSCLFSKSSCSRATFRGKEQILRPNQRWTWPILRQQRFVFEPKGSKDSTSHSLDLVYYVAWTRLARMASCRTFRSSSSRTTFRGGANCLVQLP